MSRSRFIVRSCIPVLSAVLLNAAVPRAGVGDQLAKLLANDGAQDDQFGISVAISGTNVIVGAYHDDDNGNDSGSAYLYDALTGLQSAKLLPNDGGPNDLFGYSVAVSGTTAIVGAYGDLSFSGSAYLFDTSTGLQLAKLHPVSSMALDQFGLSVAISGTTAIVGAMGDDDNGSDSGSAYLYDTLTGSLITQLLPNDGAASDRFGGSVSISGTVALIGASGDDDLGNGSGSAYLFDTVSGMQIAKLLPDDGSGGLSFGASVAISGSTAIIGAFGGNENGFQSGAAYLFDTVTGLQIAKLLPSDGAAMDLFGENVAISGRTAIISSKGDDDNGNQSGSAYLFDTVTGLQIDKLLSTDGAVGDFFSQSLAISGATAIVGAYRDDDNRPDSGSAYLFEAPATPALSSEVTSISLGTGGTQALLLDGGVARAGWPYFVFGSVTGTSPGIDFGGGVVLPLNFDAYLNLTLKSPGLGIFGNYRGTLNGDGQALAAITLPMLMDPSLIGITLNHAYIAGPVLGTANFASNAVPVLLTM